MASDKTTFNKSHLTFDRKKKSVNCQLSIVNCPKWRPGFTLAELTVAFTITGFMAVLVIAVYFAYFRLFSNQSTSLDLANQNKIAIDEITNQIRESQSVVTTCTSCGDDTTGSQLLILQFWPLNASGEPTDPTGSTYDYVVYRRDNTDYTKLIKKVIPDATSSRKASNKIIAGNISNLQFAYDNANVTEATEITVTLTASATNLSKTHTNTLSAKALLRNK